MIINTVSFFQRRDSTHSNNSGSEPHYYNSRHYGSRGKHNTNMHSPNAQPSYVPHHAKKPMSPHMSSATSPNMNANQSSGNWQNNQYVNVFYFFLCFHLNTKHAYSVLLQYRPSQYYAPNSYPMPMPTYGGQAFVPQPATSKAIPIINPNTSEVINLSGQSASATKDASSVPATASVKVDEKETKEFKIAATPSRAIKIVNPRVSSN